MDTIKSSPSGHPPEDVKRLAEQLRRLEERYRHEDLGTEERCEFEDRVKHLRRKLSERR